jgi:hypothetical protein
MTDSDCPKKRDPTDQDPQHCLKYIFTENGNFADYFSQKGWALDDYWYVLVPT